jgi:hypothetical protein
MSFEIQQEQQPSGLYLKFIGGIDEEAQFPELKLSGRVTIDLSGVSAINSIGIRSWIRWFSALGDGVAIEFIYCPKALVMQMNMVEGFLPAQAKVKSLQVPFYCEECDEEKDVMFEVGKHITIVGDQVKLNYDKATICGGGCDPELDVSEIKYFRFLFGGVKAA